MSRYIIAILFLFVCGYAYAQTGATAPIFGIDQCIWIEEVDGDPANVFCGKLLVTNDTFTDNGDGTFSLSTGSGSGTGGCWNQTSGGALVPVNSGSSCSDTKWNETSSGNLVPINP